MEDKVEIKKVKKWKLYEEYSEEELAQLPPLPGKLDFEFEKEHYVWNGRYWALASLD